MIPNTRACIAYVSAKLISRSSASSVYDYSQSRYINISGSVSRSSINIYDYDRGCHFGGSSENLYDYGQRAHVSLSINGNQFSGYDYGSRCHYNGTVNGNSVSFYDYGESKYFNFSV